MVSVDVMHHERRSGVVVCGHCPVTLFLTIQYETLKWLSSLPISMQEPFLVVTV